MRYTKYKIRNAKYEPQVTSHESRTKAGVTLVEMLIVVAIIAILVSTVISIATRTDNQAREQLAENTIAILTAALEQFGDYGYNYRSLTLDFTGFDFPLDCNGFSDADLQATLIGTFDPGVVINRTGNYDPNYPGSEALYFFLSRVPTSRKTLDKIDGSLIISDGTIVNTVNGRKYPLLRIIDPWGTTLRYDYYVALFPPVVQPDIDNMILTRRSFPVITSAGPDRIFGTDDDISSR